MSRKCVICSKKSKMGMNVSHSNHKTKREFLPNLQKINIILAGKKVKEYVCTKCLKSGKIQKAV